LRTQIAIFPDRDAGRAGVVRQPVGRFESHRYSNAAGTRDYKLYVPSAYHGQALPLIVMLHGCTQDPDDFAAGTRMNALAEKQDFFVAYPGQSRSANPNGCWNWFRRSDQQRDQGEPSLIAGIARTVMAEHALDNRQVYVAGLSAGGAMAAVLGATYPDVFAAVGVHSGLAFGAAHDLQTALAAMRSGRAGAPVADVPTIVFHGDGDSIVHPRNGDELIAQWLAGKPTLAMTVEQGPRGQRRPCTRRVLRNAAGDPILEHWLIHGAGHAWSGGSEDGSHTDKRGPDASSEMLRFFLANPRYAEDSDSGARAA
jgi:poly(hydroxyalkanoate) depolymerase family esterase